jgi:hypothetical protein
VFTAYFSFAFAVYLCLHGVGSDLALAYTSPKSEHSSVIIQELESYPILPLEQVMGPSLQDSL